MLTPKKLLPLLAAACLVIACNDNRSEPNTNEQPKDSVSSTKDTTQMMYDATKDGMLIAPEYTRKLADTLGVKMYELTIKPGDSVGLHAHPDHAVYILQGGKAAVYFEGSGRQEMDFNPGFAMMTGPVADYGRNIGKTTIKMIVIDIYRPRAQ